MEVAQRVINIQHRSMCMPIFSRISMRFFFLFFILFSGYGGLSQRCDLLTFSFNEEIQTGVLDSKVQWPHQNDSLVYGLTGEYKLDKSHVSSSESFAFWLQVQEGNYEITVLLGNEKVISNTTIKAESRRLMVYDHTTKQGAIDTVVFAVNVRSARINASDSIRLKSREFDYLNWDRNLTLEFGGERPSVRNIIIERKETLPTIFLAGNSTVVDQEKEPWASWGQMFSVFLKPNVVVANFAESGESLKSFIRAGRLDKIASLIKPGDYLFLEFAHNDQKPGGNHVEPYTSYTEYLMKFVKLARNNGATPVLVTSTNRRRFDEDGYIVNTLEEYPDAMRRLAENESVMLIDLNAMSKILFEALGSEDSKKAFVHYEAGTFPGQQEPLADNTHFSTYGAWQLAKCIVKGIQESKSPLRKYLKDTGNYDPKKPDPHNVWKWPAAYSRYVNDS